MNLVTVVTPYFKKNHVITSIKSVLAQTYKNFELMIVYDDEDMTDLEIIENLKKRC